MGELKVVNDEMMVMKEDGVIVAEYGGEIPEKLSVSGARGDMEVEK